MGCRDIARTVGYVPQETLLLHETIFTNVILGDPTLTAADAETALRAADAWEFVGSLPEKMDTLVGERGARFSGGQRQRVSIARAILKDPQVLIFDEATSALDTESELLVQEAIDHLLEGRTTFVIAHRLSTIQNADKILVLEGGIVREFGTHDQLIDSGGTYKKLYELQFGLVS